MLTYNYTELLEPLYEVSCIVFQKQRGILPDKTIYASPEMWQLKNQKDKEFFTTETDEASRAWR